MDYLLSQLPQIEERDILNLTLTATSAEACLRGQCRISGRLVAVKLLRRHPQRGEKVKQPHHVTSERLLVPLGVYQTRFFSGLVWEWMPEGSLHSLLYETRLYPEFPICLRLRILCDVAEGLLHLHSIPIPHLALRATHVLLDRQHRAKLCDWGLSDLQTLEKARPCYRNLAYMSQEELQASERSVKTDIYTFGVLLWETLNRRRASEDLVQHQLMLRDAEQGLKQSLESSLLPSDTPNHNDLTQLVLSCWNSDSKSHPSAEDCFLVLRKALLLFDPLVPVKAALHLKELKERALQSCKDLPAWEIPIELNNLETSDDYKCMCSKTLPMDIPQPHTHYHESAGSSSSKSPASPPPPRNDQYTTGCYGGQNQASPCLESPKGHCVLSKTRVQETERAWASSPSVPSPSPSLHSLSPPRSNSTPLQATQPQTRSRNQGVPGSSLTRRLSCRGLLQERREVIVRGMTEGRLNHLLDVLRSRQALSCEAYEIITAAVTLNARTRCMLDACCCLGEKVATLVAITLGLVSTSTITITRDRSQMAH